MFKNYFKTAWRNLTKNKARSFINIAGLTVGFAVFLLIFFVIDYEQSFDQFHANKNNIYRVVRIGNNAGNVEYSAGIPFPVAQALRTDFPQLQNAAGILSDVNVPIRVLTADGATSKKFKEPNVLIAEPQFFDMFDFSLAEGNSRIALSEPNSALLTKDIASKYFGDWKTATGKTINLYGRNIKVNGILNNPPSNTDFPVSVVLSYVTLINNTVLNDWISIQNNYCFIQVKDNSSVSQFSGLLKQFKDKHQSNYNFELQPLNEMHFDARYGNFTGHTFSKDLIFALSLIGLFLLIIACVNFINLTTAQAINRSREVGVRKVLGSSRAQLILQFLGETGLTVLLAFVGSVIVIFLCLPSLNNLLETHLSLTILYDTKFILFTIVTLFVVTFLSGFYPGLVLSGFKSINVLKNVTNVKSKGISFRRSLVVFQFVIAQSLIIGTLVVASQMSYFKNADMGFNREAIINAHFPGDSISRTKTDFLLNELNRMPGVQQVSFSAFAPAEEGGWYTGLRAGNEQETNDPGIVVSMKPADTGYFSLYHLQLVAGRLYFPSDTMRELVVNETVVRNLGIHDPADAIGKMVRVSRNGFPVPIVGVVKDFNMASLRDSIRPVVLTSMKRAYGLANVKVDMSKAKDVITSMQTTWNKYFPDYAFDYSFLDQSIAGYYKQEDQLSVLYKLFSGIAIFISCLGLYGLVSFMAVQRRKEIGIRKVLGAPVYDLVVKLSKEFTLLITIAFLIAAPIAWYFMHQWLQQYTYRIMIGIGFFIATIVGSLCIAWLTVGYITIKAATANPVKSLRTE